MANLFQRLGIGPRKYTERQRETSTKSGSGSAGNTAREASAQSVGNTAPMDGGQGMDEEIFRLNDAAESAVEAPIEEAAPAEAAAPAAAATEAVAPAAVAEEAAPAEAATEEPAETAGATETEAAAGEAAPIEEVAAEETAPAEEAAAAEPEAAEAVTEEQTAEASTAEPATEEAAPAEELAEQTTEPATEETANAEETTAEETADEDTAPAEETAPEAAVPAEEVTETAPETAAHAEEAAAQEEQPDASAELIRCLSQIEERLARLESQFEGKIAHTDYEDKVVDRMHKELQQYKQDMYLKIMRPLFSEVIDLRNSIAKDTQGKADDEMIPVSHFRGFLDELEYALESCNVETYRDKKGDLFDPKTMHIIHKIPTTEQAWDKKVAEVLTDGYRYEDKILVAEKVDVYVYQEP